MQLRGVVKCPKCGSVYHRALYDFDYISCTKSGCGQDFVKCTGQPWPRNSEPVELAATTTNKPSATCLLCGHMEVCYYCKHSGGGCCGRFVPRTSHVG